MAWYSSGTVNVTNGVPNVTLSGGDALLNISPDDGFVGPDGRTYPILTIGGSGTFTLAGNYLGPTASAQDYAIIPVADFNQLRSLLISVNTLITEYQDVTVNAGIGLFEAGTASLPGVRANGHEGTGLVWNADGSLSISVDGSIVATFNVGGSDGPVTEAPIDGLYYARMDGGWVAFDPNGGGGGAVTSVNGQTGAVTLAKADVGLGNVDNTADAAKPISTATQTALNAKANSAITITANGGLTGGGNLTANRTIALSSTSLASLALADSAIQASDLGDLAYVDFPAVPAGNVLNDSGNWVPQGGGGGGSGTVTSVAASGGTTGFGFTGGPITSTGTLTLTISNAATARTALGLGTIATLAAPSGSVVGTTGAQTLSDKTLTAPVINGYTEGDATASGTAFSPSLAQDTMFHYTTTGNATVTMPTAVRGKSFVVVIQYGGAHSLSWAGAAIRWSGGAAPTPTSVSGKRDTFPFFCVDGTSWQNGGMNA